MDSLAVIGESAKPRRRFGRPAVKREHVLSLWDAGERDMRAISNQSGATIASVSSWLSRAGRTPKRIKYTFHCSPRLNIVAREQYDCTGSELARRMIEIIVKEDMFLAVLGE